MKLFRGAFHRAALVAFSLILTAAPLFPISSSDDPSAFSNQAALLRAAYAGTAIPQQSADGTHSGNIRTIYVAAAATDGVPIDNLRLEDFSVTENGEPQQILSVSPASATPLVIGVLVDWSGSAKYKSAVHDELDLLWQFLKAAITKSDKALVMAFNDDTWRVSGITNDLQELRAGLVGLSKASPRGSTALYDSLEALNSDIAKDSSSRKIVLVLSDFEDNTSKSSLEKTLTRLTETGSTIFSLFEWNEMGPRKAETRGWRTAQLMAKQSGGFAYRVKAPANLAAALNQLLVAIRSSYAVEYRATGTANKHNVVNLKVELRRAGASVFAPQCRAASPS